MAFRFKNLIVGTLLGAAFLAFSAAAWAQETTCNLKLNPGSFVEGTTDTKPVENVSLTVINVKTGQPLIAGQSADLLYENLSSGNYKVSAARAGYRTTNDIITLDCAYAVQGVAVRLVPMWEGDPAKSVNYTRIDHSYDKKPSEKTPQDKFKLGEIGEGESSSRSPAAPKTDKAEFSISGADTAVSKDALSAAGGTLSKGVINGSAIILARPHYPPTAKAVGASGAVSVQVLIDEDGYVIAAEAASGHPLLKGVSALAAKASRFRPTLLSGEPVKVMGIIVYNFQ